MTELRITVPDEIADRLARVGADRGASAEDVAAELLRQHAPPERTRSLAFVGIFDTPEGTMSVAEAERRLEDGDDAGFAQ